MVKQELIIERADDGFFGRTTYEDNLIVDEAASVEELQLSFKKLLKSIHGVDPQNVEFELIYDLSALFDNFSYLKISSVAEKAGVNAGLLRQYVSGVKFPSATQAKKIEDAVRNIGNELKQVHVYAE